MRRKNMSFFSKEWHIILFLNVNKKKGGSFMKESKFQADLKKELKKMFPGCIVTKLDSSDIQGIPDLLVLNKDRWATLENKRSKNAAKQPNQEYYVNKMNEMSFSRFIFPENKDEVLNDLSLYFNN